MATRSCHAAFSLPVIGVVSISIVAFAGDPDDAPTARAQRLLSGPTANLRGAAESDGGVASAVIIEFRWLSPDEVPGTTVTYPPGTTGTGTNDLVLPGVPPAGQPLLIAAFISGWGLSQDGTLSAAQAELDSDSLPAGVSVWRPACPGDDDGLCESLIGTALGSGCNVAPIADDTCAPAVHDDTRPDTDDFVPGGCSVATNDLGCYILTFFDPPHPDPGFSVYIGTFALFVDPSLGTGPANIQFLPELTYAAAGNEQPHPVKLVPATIAAPPPCCTASGSCLPATESGCAAGETAVQACLGDCDGNGRDDGCEFVDCNGNDRLDTCDLADGSALDCNLNRIPDECDITGGAIPDHNGNTVPDDCETKNRFISFVPADQAVAGGAVQQAYRVTLVDLHGFAGFNGEMRWIGPVDEYSEDATPPMINFLAAPVQCCPHFQDRSPSALRATFDGDGGIPGDADASKIHAFGPSIVPDSEYIIQAVDESCPDLSDEGCYSAPLTVQTSPFGSIWPPYPALGADDISSVVRKYKGIAYDPGPPPSGAPPKVHAWLRSNMPDLHEKIGFLDVGMWVNAYKTIPYDLPGPMACPPCE